MVLCGVKIFELYVRRSILGYEEKGIKISIWEDLIKSFARNTSYFLSNVSCDDFNGVKLKTNSNTSISSNGKILAID